MDYILFQVNLISCPGKTAARRQIIFLRKFKPLAFVSSAFNGDSLAR
jgi:hypothetical protein